MLIPIGIILYTVAGGLKATFISSYIHTVIIYVVLCLFSFMVYTPSSVPALGSPSKVEIPDTLIALQCMSEEAEEAEHLHDECLLPQPSTAASSVSSVLPRTTGPVRCTEGAISVVLQGILSKVGLQLSMMCQGACGWHPIRTG